MKVYIVFRVRPNSDDQIMAVHSAENTADANIDRLSAKYPNEDYYYEEHEVIQ